MTCFFLTRSPGPAPPQGLPRSTLTQADRKKNLLSVSPSTHTGAIAHECLARASCLSVYSNRGGGTLALAHTLSPSTLYYGRPIYGDSDSERAAKAPLTLPRSLPFFTGGVYVNTARYCMA